MKTYSFRVPCELNHARVTANSKKAAAELYAAVNQTTFAEAQSLYAGIANDKAEGESCILNPLTLPIFDRHVKMRVVDRLKDFRDYVTANPNTFAVFNGQGQFVTVR